MGGYFLRPPVLAGRVLVWVWALRWAAVVMGLSVAGLSELYGRMLFWGCGRSTACSAMARAVAGLPGRAVGAAAGRAVVAAGRWPASAPAMLVICPHALPQALPQALPHALAN